MSIKVINFNIICHISPFKEMDEVQKGVLIEQHKNALLIVLALQVGCLDRRQLPLAQKSVVHYKITIPRESLGLDHGMLKKQLCALNVVHQDRNILQCWYHVWPQNQDRKSDA